MFQDGSNIVKKMNGIFCFRVKDKDGKEAIWVVDAKNGSGSVSFGGPGLLHRGSYMSAHVLLNELNKLGKRDKMRG